VVTLPVEKITSPCCLLLERLRAGVGVKEGHWCSQKLPPGLDLEKRDVLSAMASGQFIAT